MIMVEASKRSKEQATEAILKKITKPKESQTKCKLQSSEERGTSRPSSYSYTNERDRTTRFKDQNRGDDTGTVAFYKENALFPFCFISMDNLDNNVYFNDHILTEGQRGKITKGAQV